MSAAAVGFALAWLIIMLHVEVHGGRSWPWFLGYVGFLIVHQLVERFMNWIWP
jgi:hypothetical protein